MIRLIIVLIALVMNTAAQAERLYSTDELRDDFAMLYSGLKQAQYDPFHQIDEASLNSAYEIYRARLDQPLSLREASALFQQFVALIKTAHTRVEFPIELYRTFVGEGGKTLPLYLTIEDERVLVDDYFGSVDGLASGAEIIAVNGLPVREWLAGYSTLISADNQRLNDVMIGMQLPAMLWWADGEVSQYRIKFKSPSGVQMEQSVVTTSIEAQAEFYGTNEDAMLREYRMLDASVAYLKPGPFYNAEGDNPWDATGFKQWVDEAFRSFQAANAKAVVLDLRDNPGGTNAFSDYMLAWIADQPFKFASEFRVKVSEHASRANRDRLALSTDENDVSYRYQTFYSEHENGQSFLFPLDEAQPFSDRHFDGEVIALVDRYSFSNAVSVAAIVQDYNFGMIVGEKTADLATTYGAMEQFTLPHTALVVGFPKAHIIRPNGDPTPDGVTPDVEMQMGSDVLDRVLLWMNARH